MVYSVTKGQGMTATALQTTTPNRLGVRTWIGWFVIGLLTAFGLQFLQVQALGGTWDSLISVGSSSELRPIIEGELGPVFLKDSSGHDGQFSYVTGLDPDGSDYAELMPDGGYRWRRVLYPALAGIGGILGGKGLLVSLTVWAALGMGLASASVVDIGQSLGLRRYVAVGVLANPGIWFSVQLLTSDALAVGLALLGISLVLRRNPLAWLFLAGALLAKDQYLIVALALVAYLAWRGDRKRALALMIGSTLPLALWTLFLHLTVGGAAGASGNLAWPVAGIAKGIGRWDALQTSETVLGLLALASVALAAIAPWFTKR